MKVDRESSVLWNTYLASPPGPNGIVPVFSCVWQVQRIIIEL